MDAGSRAMNLAVFSTLGIVLVIVGVVIIVTAIILASKGKNGKVRGAGVIFIGPIPIIFGTDTKSVKFILMLALVLTIVVLIIIIVNYWLLR